MGVKSVEPVPFDPSPTGELDLLADHRDGEHAEIVGPEQIGVADDESAVPLDRPLGVDSESERRWGEALEDFRELHRGPSGDVSLIDLASDIRQLYTKQFTPAWSQWMWGRLLRKRDWVCQWAESSVLLTYTARTRLGSETMVAPGTHYDQLTSSRGARRKALHDALGDVETTLSVTVVGAHDTGHLHVHQGVVTDEPVTRDRFQGVLNAHTNNCDWAETDAHPPAKAVTVRSPADVDSLFGELAANVPGLNCSEGHSHGIIGEAPHRVAGATVLDAGDWRAVRFGQST